MLRVHPSLAVFFISLTLGLSSLALAGPPTRPGTKGLTQADARFRAASIENVRYELAFELSGDEAQTEFSGTSILRFVARQATEGLTVDFEGGSVKELLVNGKRQEKVVYNGLFITLPALAAGANEVVVRFVHPYSDTGSGLYRFKDPEDGKTYLYTDFEPFDANQLFPAFDQPDLKATYAVKVDTPSDWTVVTSVRESAKEERAGGRTVWTFPESAKFSTYIFSLIAGPYQVWEGKAGDVPLRLLARRSLGKYVPAEEWLTITKQGLAFFGSYFDYAYPFKKYDQVVVPDFNAGAMENVAAVTFSERFVPRGEPSSAQREDRADVILHEMAHMWFGDLVTMRWWNDLWLNEAFATYMATLATAEATEFKQSWQTFYTDTKQWAYWEDQLVTTHPIEGVVPDTQQAFANFDGITYGKGASSLKALSYYIGADAFRDGVRQYFKTHQYGNAERQDFMAALSKAAGRDLRPWAKEWLQTAGLNTVAAKYECQDGKVKGFRLEQSAGSDHPTLRTHRTKVGLFAKGQDGRITEQATAVVTYQGKSTPVAALNGQACPHLVYPNYEDYDFVKVRLDDRTLKVARTDIGLVADPLLRSMLWTSLWDAVLDGEWPVDAYADTVFARIGAESDVKILEKVVSTIHGRRRSSSSIAYYLPPGSAAASFKAKAEAFAWTELGRTKPGSDAQKIWFDAYVRAVQSTDGQARLAAILAGKQAFPGLEVDQDRRWDVLAQLAELGAAKSGTLRAAEAKRDATSRGKQAAITVEVLQPTKAVKTAWYAKITDPKSSLSLAELRAAMSGMFPNSQRHLAKDFASTYFRELPALAKSRPNEFIGRFASSLAPAYCEARSAKALADFAVQQKSLPPVARKAVRVSGQEDGRCVRIRKLASEDAGQKSH